MDFGHFGATFSMTFSSFSRTVIFLDFRGRFYVNYLVSGTRSSCARFSSIFSILLFLCFPGVCVWVGMGSFESSCIRFRMILIIFFRFFMTESRCQGEKRLEIRAFS
jgi:hypothetical protein